MRKVTNSSVIFSTLNVVCSRNVEPTTLNIALLGRQPKYCEIPFSFALELPSVFFIFGPIFVLRLPNFVFFNVFVSFSGIQKGARTLTTGFTCSRANFVFQKNKNKNLVPDFLLRNSVDLYAVA